MDALAPPDQTDALYAMKRDGGWPVTSAIENIFAADLDLYPKFGDAKQFRVEQRPGDLLFVPSGWWHTARNQSDTITVAWDHLNGSCWRSSVDWRMQNMNNRTSLFKVGVRPMFTLLNLWMESRERLQRQFSLPMSTDIL